MTGRKGAKDFKENRVVKFDQMLPKWELCCTAAMTTTAIDSAALTGFPNTLPMPTPPKSPAAAQPRPRRDYSFTSPLNAAVTSSSVRIAELSTVARQGGMVLSQKMF